MVGLQKRKKKKGRRGEGEVKTLQISMQHCMQGCIGQIDRIGKRREGKERGGAGGARARG